MVRLSAWSFACTTSQWQDRQGRNKGQQEPLGVVTQGFLQPACCGCKCSLLSTIFLRSADVKQFQVLPPLPHAASRAHSLLEISKLKAGAPVKGLQFHEVCGKVGGSGTEDLEPPEVIIE